MTDASPVVPQLYATLPTPECYRPGHCALFLDLDGTLVEIAHDPAAVRADSALFSLISILHAATGGALALISGRPIADIDAIFKLPSLPVAGQHGAERRDARGIRHVSGIDIATLERFRTRAQAWVASHPGLMVEDKGLSLAFHFRAAPGLAQSVAQFLDAEISHASGPFQIQSGKMVLEIRPSGYDKGRAIQEFLGEAPFAGRMPIFIGDDVSDELGFAAVNTLGGVSIKVGAEPSCARYRLPNVEGVHQWLRNAAANCTDNA